MDRPGLVIAGLSAGYGARRIVRDLTIAELPPGSLTALVGPNGSGKSTLLRALAGLIPARGTARLSGADLLSMAAPQRAGLVSYLPQTLPAGSSLRVIETTVVALRAAGRVPLRRAAAAALAALEHLCIADLALERLDRLSGGQRQLAGLAQIVAGNAPLVLLDEPTSALDLRGQIEVMAIVAGMARAGATVIAVLHDLEIAARWADRLVLLERGRLHAEGPPPAVLTPASLAAVYGVEARVERGGDGTLTIAVERAIPAAAKASA